MKRHLRGLRERGEQDQRRDGRVERMRDDGFTARRHRGQTRRRGHVEEQHPCREQREPPATGHDQRLQGGRPGVFAFVVEADEQE